MLKIKLILKNQSFYLAPYRPIFHEVAMKLLLKRFEIFCFFKYNREKELGGTAMNDKKITTELSELGVEIPTYFDDVTFEDIETALRELLLLIQNTHSVKNLGPELI